jgi:protein-tyrosine phosphatase
MTQFTILTVCTGNICRSPLTAQLLAIALRDESQISVVSAGTNAVEDQSMPDPAQAIARELGVRDPETHLSRSLTPSHLHEANLVIALSRTHRRKIVQMYPKVARRTFTLREFARLVKGVDVRELTAVDALPAADVVGRLCEWVEIAASRRGTVVRPDSPDDDDVVDPYRREESVYRRSASQIVSAVEVTVREIRRALDAPGSAVRR